MRVVVAPQEFKGSLTAAEAARAIAAGVRDALPGAEVVLAPMSDGGAGLVDTKQQHAIACIDEDDARGGPHNGSGSCAR